MSEILHSKCKQHGIPYCSTEHVMSMYWNVCLVMFTLTETCSKLYSIEYIVVFWLNDFLVRTLTQRVGSYQTFLNYESYFISRNQLRMLTQALQKWPCLFHYGSFIDDINRSEHPAWNGRNLRNILERIWKEVVVPHFELLYLISVKRLRQSMKILNQGTRTEIWIRDLRSTKQQCYQINSEVGFYSVTPEYLVFRELFFAVHKSTSMTLLPSS